MKCEEKGVDVTPVVKKITSNQDNFRSGRAIEKLIVEEYISQFGSRDSAKKIQIDAGLVTKGTFINVDHSHVIKYDEKIRPISLYVLRFSIRMCSRTNYFAQMGSGHCLPPASRLEKVQRNP